jgi:hypothetical protein
MICLANSSPVNKFLPGLQISLSEVSKNAILSMPSKGLIIFSLSILNKN